MDFDSVPRDHARKVKRLKAHEDRAEQEIKGGFDLPDEELEAVAGGVQAWDPAKKDDPNNA